MLAYTDANLHTNSHTRGEFLKFLGLRLAMVWSEKGVQSQFIGNKEYSQVVLVQTSVTERFAMTSIDSKT